MKRFIYASELKSVFKVYGGFYNLKTSEKEIIKCRNILEIYRAGYIAGVADPIPMFFGKPDSVFVMMNPGSSEPRENGFREPKFILKGAEKSISRNRMVKAKPDVTQYQVMRVMQEMNWNHVRVVNLSDIRESKSLIFFKRLKKFESEHGDIHTIFSRLRRDEIKKVFLMRREDSPIIPGWGMDTHLLPLAKKVYDFLQGFNIKGIPSKKNSLLYPHPSPNIQTAKIDWLNKIVSELKKTEL